MSPDLLFELVSGILITGIALLDSLPDSVRAMLAATVLVAFLRFFESRIPIEDVQLGEAFCKSSLVAMIAIPLSVWLLPAYRMVVFVDVLPETSPHPHPGWMLLAAVWMTGFGAALIALITSHRKTRAALELQEFHGKSGAPETQRLMLRLAHWQRRLSVPQTLSLVLLKGAQPRNLNSRHRIGFPAAALHWPVSAQDVLIIQALCRIKLHHRRWLLLAQILNCCYWPITWAPALQRRLLTTFQLTMEGLAESCFLDPLGYRNAVRQVEQRLPVQERADTKTRSEDERAPDAQPVDAIATLRRITAHLRGYVHDLGRLFEAPGEIAWQPEIRDRDAPELRWAEPYDRVFLRVGQAVFFAVLLTGVTLKESPPVIEFEARGWLEVNWMDQYFRNPNRNDHRRDPLLPPAD
ncbi:MAG: hypothetical protein R3E82_22555 [Pseudomonadales bacterium]|nr:hypothetical protein [Pseudomonadales bacterium]